MNLDQHVRALVAEEVARLAAKLQPPRPPVSVGREPPRAISGAREIARYLGMTRNTFYDRRAAAKRAGIPFPEPLGSSGRPGRKKRFLLREIDAWDQAVCIAELEGKIPEGQRSGGRGGK